MKSKIQILLYLVAACAFFGFWMLWVFPYSALESRILTEVENNFRGRYKIEAGETDLSLWGSLDFKNLSLKEPGAEGGAVFKTPKLEVDFSPWALLSKNIDVDFYLKGQGRGDVEGSYRQTPDLTSFEAELDSYPMADLKGLFAKANLAFRGELKGEAKAELHAKDPPKNQGDIDIELVNLSLDPTRWELNIPNLATVPLSIPRVKLTGPKDSHIQGKVKGRQVEFSSIRLQDGDLIVDMKGTLNIASRNASDYQLNLEGTLKISDKFLNNLKAQQSKEVAGNIESLLVLLDQQKTPEGVYPISIEGRLSGKPEVKIGKFRVPM